MIVVGLFVVAMAIALAGSILIPLWCTRIPRNFFVDTSKAHFKGFIRSLYILHRSKNRSRTLKCPSCSLTLPQYHLHGLPSIDASYHERWLSWCVGMWPLHSWGQMILLYSKNFPLGSWKCFFFFLIYLFIIFFSSLVAIQIWLYLLYPSMKENTEFPATKSIKRSMLGKGNSSFGHALSKLRMTTQHLIYLFFFFIGTILESH